MFDPIVIISFLKLSQLNLIISVEYKSFIFWIVPEILLFTSIFSFILLNHILDTIHEHPSSVVLSSISCYSHVHMIRYLCLLYFAERYLLVISFVKSMFLIV